MITRLLLVLPLCCLLVLIWHALRKVHLMIAELASLLLVDLRNYLAIVLVFAPHEYDVLVDDLRLVDLLLSLLQLLDHLPLLLYFILQDYILLSKGVPLRLVFRRKLHFSLHLHNLLLKFADFAFVVLRFEFLFCFCLQYISLILESPALPTREVLRLNLYFQTKQLLALLFIYVRQRNVVVFLVLFVVHSNSNILLQVSLVILVFIG